MIRCDHCQSVLLDHLYGLLDPAEAVVVEEHLAGCSGCTAARDQAARVRGLFGRAAKSEFPKVQFTPPLPFPPVPVQPAPAPIAASSPNGPPVEPAIPSTLAKVAKPSRRGVWVGWAVAAGVMLMVGGTMLPLTRLGRDYEMARLTATDSLTRTADARSSLDRAIDAINRERALLDVRSAAARQRHDTLLAEWSAAEKAANRVEENRPLSVEVVKPASVQPGAPNEFFISVQGKNSDDYRIEAEVRDQGNTVLRSWPIQPQKNPGNPALLRLPAEVWTRVGPQSELFLVVAATHTRTGTRTELLDRIRLFGPVYATMLATDRPEYRPGERVYFRSLTLDRVTFRPPAREQVQRYDLRKIAPNPRPGEPAQSVVNGTDVTGRTGLVRVIDDKVEPVLGPDGTPIRGVGCGAFVLPANLDEGEYVLTLTEIAGPGGLPPLTPFPVTRTIRVRSSEVETYSKKIGFTKASYSPGDVVEAWVEMKSQDQPAAGVVVDAVVTADGHNMDVRVLDENTDRNGRARITFRVPFAEMLPRGDVQLKVILTPPTGGKPETAIGRVPVIGRGVVVEFFPEGGKLIAGVPCRVYVRATTPLGLPVELKGTVTDGRSAVARVETLNDPAQPGANRGLGVFAFTPRPGIAYWMTLEQPAGVAPAIVGPIQEAPAAVLGAAAALAFRAGFALPAAEVDGVAMTVLDPVTKPGQPIRVRLHSPHTRRNLVVGAYTRGRLGDTKKVTVDAGKPEEVQLLVGVDPRGGVTRITVFEDVGDGKELLPVAERLVFRQPGERLNLAVEPNRTLPLAAGSPVELNITATDEQGRPAPAILWAAVTNAAQTANPKDRLMPTHFLLGGEVQSPDQLEYADFLLTDHPKAAQSLDLVLATQGWRRFAEQSAPRASLLKKPLGMVARETDRVVAVNGQYPVLLDPSPAREEHRRLAESYWPRYETAAKELDAAERARVSGGPAAKELLAHYETARQETVKFAATAESVAEPLTVLRGWLWHAMGGLGVVALGFWVVALLRPIAAMPLVLSALSTAGLGVYLPFAVKPYTSIAVPDAVALADTPEPPQAPVTPGVGNAISNLMPSIPDAPLLSPGPKTASNMFPAAMAPGARPPWHPGALWQPGAEFRRPGLENVAPAGPKRFASRIALTNQEPADLQKRAGDYATKDAAIANGKINAFADAKKSSGDPLEPEVLTRIRETVPLGPPLVVRDYAAPRPGASTMPANADTLLWQPVIVLPSDGKTTLSFTAGSANGGYQVMVAGHTPDGRIGATRLVLPVK